jgi:hypothetical protein
VPWSDRLAPGDLGATDALPYRADDPYLEPGYALTGEEDEDRLAVWELGLGRPRVLSLEGRDAAASRWYAGDRGPTSEEALHASAACATCGYFLPLAGSLRRAFGVCGNEWSPSDAKVVSVDHGCGAHSETDVEAPEPIPLPEPILDETGAEAVTLIPHRAPEAPEVQQAAEAAAVGELAAQQQAEAAEALADPVEVLADPVAELAGEPADPVGEPAEGLHGGTDGGSDGGTDGGSDGGPAPDPRP